MHFFHVYQSKLMLVDLKLFIFFLKFGPLWEVNTLKRFMNYLKGLFHERIFKVFYKFEKLLLRGQKNLTQILCSWRSAMSLATGIAECTQNKHTSTSNAQKRNFLLQWLSPHYFMINQLSNTQWHTAMLYLVNTPHSQYRNSWLSPCINGKISRKVWQCLNANN
jgi:hypothetical protein